MSAGAGLLHHIDEPLLLLVLQPPASDRRRQPQSPPVRQHRGACVPTSVDVLFNLPCITTLWLHAYLPALIVAILRLWFCERVKDSVCWWVHRPVDSCRHTWSCFTGVQVSLRDQMREGCSDEELAAVIGAAVTSHSCVPLTFSLFQVSMISIVRDWCSCCAVDIDAATMAATLPHSWRC